MRKMTFGKGKQLSRRKFIVGSAALAGGGLALGLNVPFAQAQNGAAQRGQRLGRDQAGRHLRHPHRALGDGAGHAHRPRPARRRRARVRLEQGHDRRHHARPQPRQQARLGRDGHRRQPRHPPVAGLRAPRRRGRAHDAAAGGGRPVEGAGRRAHRVERRHHATPRASARPATARSRRPRRRSRRPIPRPSSSRIRRTGRSPASR